MKYTVRDDLKSELWKDYSFEICIVEINKGLLVASLYRTPDSPVKLFLKNLEILLDIANKENKTLLIGGDFNIDVLRKNPITEEFSSTLTTSNFHYLIDLPTRPSSQNPSCIDNFIINDSASVVSAGVLEIDISDHYAIYVTIDIHKPKNANSTVIVYKRSMTEQNKNEFLRQIKNETWSHVYTEIGTENKYNRFLNTFTEYLNACFPNKRTSIKTSEKNPWCTTDIKKLNSLKDTLYKVSKTNQFLKPAYTKIQKLYNKKIVHTKRRYYSNVFNKNKNDIKKTWMTLNRLVGRTKSRVEKPLQIEDSQTGVLVNNVAEYINNHFCNIGSSLGLDGLSTSDTFLNLSIETPHSFALFPITENEVINSVMRLKQNKSPGYDEITPELLKLTIPYTSEVLQHIFNSSFDNGTFPNRMKIAKVVPIHKKGSKLEVNNYRPISLLPTLSKCLESIMFTRLSSYIQKYNLISASQFGFQKSKSTIDAIVSFIDKLTTHLESGNVISLFCDLSKAFDSVNHKILIYKLSQIGIRGTQLNWFKSYLENRQQYTVVPSQTYRQNGILVSTSSSQLKEIKRGVPQGSILGPLLFLLYINDLPNNNLMADFILYADDTNLLLSDKQAHNLETKFDNIMQYTNEWFKQNQLILNSEKTYYMSFKPNRSHNSTFTSGNHKIKEAIEVKFLGITITPELSWKRHIEQIANKIRPGIAMLYKIRKLVDTSTLLHIYYSLIQSHLSYGILVWGGAPQHQIDILLKLQKKAIRIIARKNRLTSCRPLFKEYHILTVPSLYILESSCYAKKSIHSNSSTNSSRQLTRTVNEIHSHNTRHQNNIFLPNISSIKKKYNTLFNCSVIFNKLPGNLKDIAGLKQFRVATKQHLMEKTLYSVKEL